MTEQPACDTLALIAFPGAPNLPLFAAIEHGLFARAGLELTLETTPSSRYQIESLVAGRFDIAATAFDNVVAYQEGQGAVELAVQPDLCAFLGATQIELSLVVAPEIRSYADLRGKTLALDALATGFAFVLYHLLERAGLDLADCKLEAVGATPQRWEAVRDGQAAGTLMIEPFTSVAAARGFRVLETSSAALASYQGGVFTASRRWIAAHPRQVDAFVRAYLDGLTWTLDPANRAAATALLLERMPAIKPPVAAAVMDKLLDPRTGLTPAGRIDAHGMRTVLELRSRYAMPAKSLSDADRYVDLHRYARAADTAI